ncbi:hypothetical protein GGR58DRAFT_10865 [Xylaria digitata]|nr:hypothetical protein GGR58DRAFT_10865 [Xylaria digitata]
MMGLFGKGHPRSRSTGSITPQPLVQDADHDALFLPLNDNVYLTQTKDGNPALGRKKKGKLLQDFGFDILGQSFGIPSRKDYERQPRPLSAASQSSGLVTVPTTPRKNRAYTYEDTESPAVRRRADSRHSSSTTLPIEVARYDDPGNSSLPQATTYKMNPLLPTFNQHNIPPPPPPPPSVVGWRTHPMVNTGVAPIPMSYCSAAYQPSQLPRYSCNSPARFQGLPNWASPQQHIAQYPGHLGISMPQATAAPMSPHHQQPQQFQPVQISHTQAIPAVRLANILPPPPPPPPQDWLQAHAMTTNQRKMSRQHTKQTIGQPRDAGKTHEKPKNNEEVTRRLSKRIRHVHVCAGCGKKRSARYQKAHPLKRGEVPAVNYCYSCLKDAADTDYHTSDDDDDGGDPPIIKVRTKHNKLDMSPMRARKMRRNREEAGVPWPSSDEGRTIAGGNYTYEQTRHGPRWVKKSNRFGSFSRLFSRRVTSNPSPLRPGSVSSVSGPRSRASSIVSDL